MLVEKFKFFWAHGSIITTYQVHQTVKQKSEVLI